MELTTEHGWRFSATADLKLGDRVLDMDALTKGQSVFLAAKLNEAALNAAFAGRVIFQAEAMSSPEQLFPKTQTTE